MLIKDAYEFEHFVDILPDLEKDEVYYVSLAARNKYLTDEERKFYQLGNTKMFARVIVKSKLDFRDSLEKAYYLMMNRKTLNGMEIPSKCLVAYANINPSSMMKATSMMIRYISLAQEHVNNALRKDKIPNYDGIINSESKLTTFVQKATSRKNFIGIDFDIPHSNKGPLFSLISAANSKGISYQTLLTKSGFHLLLNKEELSASELNLKEEIRIAMLNAILPDGGEVIINDNMMVPIPGTIQAGHLVRFI